MKVRSTVLGFLLLASPLISASGAETAYKALRAFGAQRGETLLYRVVEVQGKAGTPQPGIWRIVLDDPKARGGIRQVEIQNSQIVAEHTPIRLYGGVATGAVMDLQKLSLDSEGAFKIANMEAKNARFGFDSVDYTLRIGDDSNTPVWVLNFLDETQKSIGSVQIAADTGNVIARNFGKPAPKAPAQIPATPQPTEEQIPNALPPGSTVPPAGATENQTVGEATPPTIVDEAPDSPNAPEVIEGREVRESRENRDSRRPRIGHEIKKGLINAGAAMEEFFTGKRTIDRKTRPAEETRPYLGDD